VIVIGGSAGAVEVLLGLAPELPENLPASIFVVVHTAPHAESLLPELLERRGPLASRHPIHGEKIEQGVIYVAPADAHLMVRRGAMEVVRAAKENGHRPAVDPLFRSASAAYGSRVIGVVLSGNLDCGTAGMLSIKARGGLGVVQAPETCQAPQMPKSALEHAKIDFTVAPHQLAQLLERLTQTPAAEERQPSRVARQVEGTVPGTPAGLVCPICHGVLTESQPGQFEHFRCHVGHTFSLQSLAQQHTEEMERALWAGVRSLEEGARLARRLSGFEHNADARLRYDEKSRTLRHQADLIRQILLHGPSTSLDPEELSESTEQPTPAPAPPVDGS